VRCTGHSASPLRYDGRLLAERGSSSSFSANAVLEAPRDERYLHKTQYGQEHRRRTTLAPSARLEASSWFFRVLRRGERPPEATRARSDDCLELMPAR